jgi:predicted lipoprotein with Yx(FWY)xxD motif
MRNLMPLDIRQMKTRWRTAIAITFVALLFAAAAPASALAATAPSPGTAAAPVVMAHTGPAGTYLVDGKGRSLYLFAIDTKNRSVCNGACATGWPPLTTTSAATAGTGVIASLLTTTKRSGGQTQVVYNGHPLYYFEGDTTPGTTSGQGVNAFGGLWWLVSAAGAPLTAKPSGSASPAPSPGGSSSSSAGGGGGPVY